MSWRDRLVTIDGESYYAGKFREAKFLVRSDGLEFGRRTEVHEYPDRDIPYVEDSGKKGRKFSIQVFVVGADYDIARNKLIKAIEQSGPGALQHPHYGVMQVSILSARASQSTSKAGQASFTLECLEGGDLLFPIVATATDVATTIAAEKSIADSIADFASKFDVLGDFADSTQGIIDEVDDIFKAIDAAIGNVTGPIAALIRAPAEMAAMIAGNLNRLRITLGEPGRALNIYRDLFNSGNTGTATAITLPTATTTQRQHATNIQALQQLVQRVAVAEAAIATTTRSYETSSDALSDAAMITAAIEVQTAAEDVVDSRPINDVVYMSMIDLRTAVTKDLRIRGAQLPKLTTHTPAATLPAIVIAYQLYGNASRDAEIVARNRIRHPGFVPGGQSLEVLAEVVNG